MKFDLRRPCPQCPFRSDIAAFLTPGRVREITNTMIRQQGTFACHKTTAHDDDGEHCPSSSEQHCAGALIFLERLGRPNQMMRIMERLGGYDRTKLDMDAPVFATPAQMIAAQPKRRA